MSIAPIPRGRPPVLAIMSVAAALLGAAPPGAACAGDVGRRDFPATLVVEEPQVETEIAPQLARFGAAGTRRTDISSDLAVKLAEPVSLVIQPDYTLLRPGGSGFQALAIGLKTQLVTDAGHEFILSAGLLGTLAGTGSPRVDADATGVLVPTAYYGKGGGDLPASLGWARPFALTGEVGIAVPTRRRPPGGSAGEVAGGAAGDLPDDLPEGGALNPVLLTLAGSLQYSLPYLTEHGTPLPRGLAALIPLVEYEIAVPIANRGAHATTVGTVNPGALYVDAPRNVTYGLEALIPINRASGRHPGVRLQLSYSFASPFLPAGRAPDQD